jgi:hypothetical protein
VLLLFLLTVRDAFTAVNVAMIAILTPVYLAGTLIGSRVHRDAADVTVRLTVLALIFATATAGLVL